MDTENEDDDFRKMVHSSSGSSLSDYFLPPAIELDPHEVRPGLQSIGRLLIPQIGDFEYFELDCLMTSTLDEFFSWYSLQTSIPLPAELRFNLRGLVADKPYKCTTVSQNNPESFLNLKITINDTFGALIGENPGLGLFIVEVTAVEGYGGSI